MNECYWTFALEPYNERFWIAKNSKWTNSPVEIALWSKGWVFKTCKEAVDVLPKVAKEYNMEYLIG